MNGTAIPYNFDKVIDNCYCYINEDNIQYTHINSRFLLLYHVQWKINSLANTHNYTTLRFNSQIFHPPQNTLNKLTQHHPTYEGSFYQLNSPKMCRFFHWNTNIEVLLSTSSFISI